jgi:hypothetical protein
MRVIAYILAVICAIVAVMYFALPADQLPTFMPGFEAGSAHVHVKHAVIAAAAAVILAVIGWLVGRRV